MRRLGPADTGKEQRLGELLDAKLHRIPHRAGALGWLWSHALDVALELGESSVAEELRPALPLVEKLGRVFTGLAGEVAQQLDVEVRGEITQYDVKVLELAALKGVFTDVVEEGVSYVNAPLLAAERGLAVRLVTDPESPDHRNLITLRGTLADSTQVSVSGTLVGLNQKERLVEVNGYIVDIEPTEHLAFFRYEDRPGVVGQVGIHLGEAQSGAMAPGNDRTTIVTFAIVALLIPQVLGAVSKEAAHTALSDVRALVVDDDPAMCVLAERLLSKIGITDVATEQDATAVVASVHRLDPDLIILDKCMPDMDGYEVARRIRRLPGGERVLLIAVTGWGHEEVRERVSAAGFDQHLVKPMSLKDLENIIAKSALR